MSFEKKCSYTAERLTANLNNWEFHRRSLTNTYEKAIKYFKYQVFFCFVYLFVFTGFDKELQLFLLNSTQNLTTRMIIKFISNTITTSLCIGFQVSKFERQSRRHSALFLPELVYTNSFMYYYHYIHILNKQCSYNFKTFCYYFENAYIVFLILDLVGALVCWHIATTQISLLDEEYNIYKLTEKSLTNSLIRLTEENEDDKKNKKLERLRRELS